MNDVMIDLETMGNGPDAAIIAIGAVEFDVENREIGERFYTVIDLDSAVDAGGVMDASTVLWWMKQSEEARSAFAGGGEHIATALQQFAAWMANRGDDVRVWGNGASFDNVVLATAYRRSRINLPWKYWNDRCYRTMKSLAPGVKMQRSGTKHNAEDDAESQALHLIEIINGGLVRYIKVRDSA